MVQMIIGVRKKWKRFTISYVVVGLARRRVKDLQLINIGAQYIINRKCDGK